MAQHIRQKPSLNARRGSNLSASNRLAGAGIWRHPAFERLEDRRLLTSIPYNTIAADLTAALNSAQTSLTNALNAYQSGDNASIPFLGSSLGDVAQFVPQLSSALSTLGATDPATAVPDAFVHALGP